MIAPDDGSRERVVRILSAATFLIFFQAFMIAPLLPRLAARFGASVQSVGLMVPAYLIAYGASTLGYGVLSDRLGRRRLMLGSFLAFLVLTALTATARSVPELVAWRAVTGLGASAVVPLGLVFIGTAFPFERRGRPLGWLFGAMAGGMAFGSTLGAVLEPLIGWRGLFIGVPVLGALVLAALFPHRALLGEAQPVTIHVGKVLAGYGGLLRSPRGQRTYAYVLTNAIFHSGVFTWLGVYFVQRYALGEVGIGIALLGYGVPGFILGPVIGHAADRWGRARLLPLGVLIAALSAALLVLHVPLLVAAILVTTLSLGYDMTQPLLAGIVTSIGGERPGQAMGLNVFALFIGFGVGSLIFGELVRRGFDTALEAFGAAQIVLAVAAVVLFRGEQRTRGAWS